MDVRLPLVLTWAYAGSNFDEAATAFSRAQTLLKFNSIIYQEAGNWDPKHSITMFFSKYLRLAYAFY